VNVVSVLTDISNSMSSEPSLSVHSDMGYRREDKYEKHEPVNSGGSKAKNPSPLRRSASLGIMPEVNTRDTVLVQIGIPDHEGWIRKKGGHFSTWKGRYLVLKDAHLYWLRTDNSVVCIAWLFGVCGTVSDS